MCIRDSTGPVGELDHRAGVGRAVGDEHDQANHLAVKPAVTWVIQLTGKHRQQRRLPADRFQEFVQVRVGLGLVLVGLAGHDIDREKGAGPTFQQRLMPGNKLRHLRLVVAITNAGADDDTPKRVQVHGMGLIQTNNSQIMP